MKTTVYEGHSFLLGGKGVDVSFAVLYHVSYKLFHNISYAHLSPQLATGTTAT